MFRAGLYARVSTNDEFLFLSSLQPAELDHGFWYFLR
jgi:hypothetical protein